MKIHEQPREETQAVEAPPIPIGCAGGWTALVAALLILCLGSQLRGQSAPERKTPSPTTEEKVASLTAALAQTQAELEIYRKKLTELREQLSDLRKEIGKQPSSASTEPLGETPQAMSQAGLPGGLQSVDAGDAAALMRSIETIREQQALEESQIATHDTLKVETESKYPLTVTGLVLFNGFVNTRQVDTSAAPAYARPGSGSTGFSARQTVLGLDARGPHVFGAASRADIRADFFADSHLTNSMASGVLRLRTAHATLNWGNTEAFFALDRTLLAPNQPSSLVSIAQPELAWAGNLWSWNPQIGASRQFPIGDTSRIELQAALIDTADPLPPGATAGPVTQTELSRWPGSEARIAFRRGNPSRQADLGLGGYFSPHRDSAGERFDAWAGTADLRLPLGSHLELTAQAYRGQALAGLGAGGYVNDFLQYTGNSETARALQDVGGWAQLQAKAGERTEFHVGYGIDNPFAREIHSSGWDGNGSSYTGLARNRAWYANAIFRPSAYVMFSLEYKRLWTDYATGPTYGSDSIGLGAGYRF